MAYYEPFLAKLERDTADWRLEANVVRENLIAAENQVEEGLSTMENLLHRYDTDWPFSDSVWRNRLAAAQRRVEDARKTIEGMQGRRQEVIKWGQQLRRTSLALKDAAEAGDLDHTQLIRLVTVAIDLPRLQDRGSCFD